MPTVPSVDSPVVLLSGGTGGAKLARGLRDAIGPALVVVANTGDDVEIHGAHVSPDPDLVLFGLAERIDARGWGLEGDTHEVMDMLRTLGPDPWFTLGDRDLAIGIDRARRLAEGERLTDAIAALRTTLQVTPTVLVPSDEPVRTHVTVDGRRLPFQEFMIRAGGKGGSLTVQDVTFDGADRARPTPEVLDALAHAALVIVGPSNPVISLGPILAVPGICEALVEGPAPVVAVSPLVGGEVLKGPTAAFLRWAGRPCTDAGVLSVLRDRIAGIDGWVADTPAADVRTHVTDVAMPDAEGRRRVADEVLRFGAALRPR